MRPDRVFKAYDIRGRTDTGDLDAALCELVGSALVELLDSDRVAVGRDVRTSSPGLFEGLARGITTAGADVIDLGEVPTDAVYYYSGAHDVPGAMITASHNPPMYNGIKLCRAGAAPIGADTGLAEIRAMVEEGRRNVADAPGSVERVDAVAGYVEHLFSIVDPSEIGPLRVAVDGGNGMAGVALERVFDRIPADLTGLYLEPDGTFPNHPADPLVPENLADLEALMRQGEYDLGVAFDGDADRAFFLDDRARPLSGSTVTSLLARRLLEGRPGEKVVHNLITSKAVPEIVTECGGIPIRTRVGHSYIKTVMAETNAIFGGEHSAHYYFRDNYRADSGMLAMLHLMAILSSADQPLSSLRGEVERYAASGEINFEVTDTDAAMRLVEESEASSASIDRLDGLTVDYGDAWFNLRPSNTEPLLRLNVEGPDADRVADIVERVRAILEEA
ncbi:MAG: phosphomannomutase/phosphoglucomutase [Acidimicrobiales bacterium]|nr:phosphomannomutase/phosphoglucomutase [Acidimicrobiales bacterium]